MKRKILLLFVLFLVGICLFIENKTFAVTDLDEIESYIVTVNPRTTDGTLDIIYELDWKVLDSSTEGPLTWVQIGTPNENFDKAVGLTDNIKSISKYNGSYVKIEFTRSYYAGEVAHFRYSIHQSYMYELDGNKVTYDFTPAWFTDAKIVQMQVRWNASDVTKSDNSTKDGNYLVWSKSNMSKGEKLSISVEYDESSFTALDANKQSSNLKSSIFSEFRNYMYIFIIVFVVVIYLLSLFTYGGGYYGHRGFYYGGFLGGPPRGRRMCT